MDLSLKTKPGYKVFSESFIAVFIAGNRKELEERRNWHDLMMHLANASVPNGILLVHTAIERLDCKQTHGQVHLPTSVSK